MRRAARLPLLVSLAACPPDKDDTTGTATDQATGPLTDTASDLTAGDVQHAGKARPAS